MLLIAVPLALAGHMGALFAEPLVDLGQIGHVASKGRVQDKAYNQHLAVVDGLINAGPAAIPFLVSKLEDDTEISGPVFDYWPRVTVGDVALVVLIDLFTTPDGRASVRDLAWDRLLHRQGRDLPAWEILADFVGKHGRERLRLRVESILNPHADHLVWVAKGMYFAPSREGR